MKLMNQNQTHNQKMENEPLTVKDIIKRFSTPKQYETGNQESNDTVVHNSSGLKRNETGHQLSNIPLHISASPLISRWPSYTNSNIAQTVPHHPTLKRLLSANQRQKRYTDCQKYIFERSLDQMDSKTSLIYKSLQSNIGKKERITKNLPETVTGSSIASDATHLKHNFESLYGNKDNNYSIIDATAEHYSIDNCLQFQFSPSHFGPPSPSSDRSSVAYYGARNYGFNITDDILYEQAAENMCSASGGGGSSFTEDNTSGYFSETDQNSNFIFDPQINRNEAGEYGVNGVLNSDEEAENWEVPNLMNHAQIEDSFSFFDEFHMPNEMSQQNLKQFPSTPVSLDSMSPYFSPKYRNSGEHFLNLKRNISSKSKEDYVPYKQINNRTSLVSFPESNGTFVVESINAI